MFNFRSFSLKFVKSVSSFGQIFSWFSKIRILKNWRELEPEEEKKSASLAQSNLIYTSIDL